MSSLQQWTPTTLGELLIFTGGSQPPLSVFSKTEHEGYIRLIQIRDYKTDKYTTYIPKDLARRFCDADDIMIGRYGPPIFQILRGLEGAYNVALIKVTPKGNILKDFAWHYLRNDRLFKHIDKLSRRTSGQTGVDLNELENYPIQLPPLAEQQKIAQALTDADNYISALEKLIEKKKMMKEGLMVNLLTGKQRLKEFALNEDSTAKGYKDSELGKIPEDWEIFNLGELLSITTGDKNTQDKVSDGAYPFFVRSQIIETSNTYSFDGEGVLTAGDGVGTGKIFHYINGKCDIHQRVYLMSNFNKKLHGYFFYLYFSRNFYNRIMSMTAKSSVDSVRKEMIADMKIYLPILEEQIEISKLIQNSTAELNNLEQKLSKFKKIKQGMMQKLLTGEIRLA